MRRYTPYLRDGYPATPATSATLLPNRSNVAAVATSTLPQLEQPESLADDYCRFEERAAICEHDGGLSPAHAEVLAALHQVAPANVIDAAARFLDRHHISTGRHGGRGRGQHS